MTYDPLAPIKRFEKQIESYKNNAKKINSNPQLINQINYYQSIPKLPQHQVIEINRMMNNLHPAIKSAKRMEASVKAIESVVYNNINYINKTLDSIRQLNKYFDTLNPTFIEQQINEIDTGDFLETIQSEEFVKEVNNSLNVNAKPILNVYHDSLLLTIFSESIPTLRNQPTRTTWELCQKEMIDIFDVTPVIIKKYDIPYSINYFDLSFNSFLAHQNPEFSFLPQDIYVTISFIIFIINIYLTIKTVRTLTNK